MDEQSSVSSHHTESLRSAIMQRQREMNDLNEYRFRTLESLVKQKEVDLNTERQKYKNLKDDFEYNLKLLEGRDEELKRYDVNFANTKKTLADKDSLISELKSTIATMESQVKQEQQRNNEFEVYYQEKIQELRNETENIRLNASEEHKRTATEYEVLLNDCKKRMREQDDQSQTEKKQLHVQYQTEISSMKESYEKKLHQADEKLINLKREMEEGFNRAMSEAINKINIEWEQKMNEKLQQNDQFKAKEWELEDKLKLLTTSLEQSRSRYKQQSEQQNHEIESLKQNIWTLEQELRNANERNDTQKRDLDARRDDIISLKEQLNASIEKEQQLTRDILRLQLQQEKEEDERSRKASEETDRFIKNLQQQKAEAQAIIEDQKQHIEALVKETRELRHKNEFQTQRLDLLNGFHVNGNERESTQRNSRNDVEKDIDEELGFSSLPPASPLFSDMFESSHFQDSVNYGDIHESRSEVMHRSSKMTSALEQAEQSIREKNRQIDRLQREVNQLGRQIADNESTAGSQNGQTALLRQLTDQISSLQQELEMRKDVTDSSNFTKLNTMLTDLRIDNERYKDKLHRAERKRESLQSENKTLRSKLKEAAKDIKRMMKEQEKLIDVSNGVRAELDQSREEYHQLQQRTSSKLHGNKREEAEIQSELKHFKGEVSRLQSSLREVIENNSALKRELQRWTGQQFEDISSIRNSKRDLVSTKQDRISIGGRLSEHLHPILNDEGYLGINSGNENNSTNVTNNGNHSEVITGAIPSEQPSRARQKIQTIRESLSMSGRPSVLHPEDTTSPPAHASERETTSQRRALHRVQRKKAELVPQRRALRRILK